uniref:NADH-ubiquinone oxidoreductase chain 2 n=1 Tax=Phrynocephalus forsythii TaxID=171643 RepID=A0A0U1YV77_9SAUR|nr:NADH dehydrogenase subunit 2 [Phrynocephalus forsythii]AJA04737.1 NADH dehydrogenase subunit 2 [Phrynocephalus forsythii]AJA04740.1 NADH dehydrogenase subunit 2 [Phrynocephalus forsythii]AJF41780.1 NADH dehydrogenase subunit 2 [Phrynocephalus forsythii]QGZ04895.1 NADH dehydrogenase subunit 2 [Phrynocephalus forsythii]QGZ04897.1 NADH dehydrogenase subunit 2 [Phrynocephalus forsythii]
MTPTSIMITALSIAMGTIMTMSSSNWLMAWIGLELNMLAILPTISKPKTTRASEATIKYFLTQAIASAMMLLSSTTNAWQTGSWDIMELKNKFSTTTMALSLMMKMGAAPVHFWLPEVLQGATLQTALLITTWQKLAPITLMYMISNNIQPTLLTSAGILSMIVGGLGGINQTQLRKTMAYSSINNLGWTIMIMALSPNLAIMNISIYIIMTTPIFLMMTNASTKTLQNLTTTWTTSTTMTISIALLMLSTSGLPPFTGFTPKMLALNELITQKLTMLATLAIMTSLISLLFYLRITYLIMMLTSPMTTPSSTKWRTQNQKSQLMTMMTPTALFMTHLIPAIPL